VSEVIPDALDGERVDRVVALLTGLPRSEVAALVAAGAVRLAGRATTTRSRRVRTGDTLEVVLPPAEASHEPVPDPGVDVAVVHADDQVIVVDKPAGLVVHPGAGRQSGTLVHGLLARFPDLADLVEQGSAVDRPGIVHRLDKGTSGLLVVARTRMARDSLVAQLAARAVDRRYAALVWGRVEGEEGLVDAPLGRADANPTHMAVRAGGREARTKYRVETRFAVPEALTLLECWLETGRTHQIRVHLSAIGHPVVGDPRYGRRGGKERLWLALDRQWLHARRLSFDHPATGERVSFTSPLPPELTDVLARLG
jgi:23S rRNA pseudouridine1911/1915/1917 synthase